MLLGATIINLVKFVLAKAGYDVLPKRVKINYLGNEYVVRNGTVDKGDYDDAWMFAIAHHSQIIFDIGSNIGQSAFNMLHAPNVECVVLVDPAPFALTIAADTLIRNRMGHRAKFIAAFVSDTDGEKISFATTGHSAGGIRHDNVPTNDSNPFIIGVETLTIDTLVAKLNLIPDFVKLDVERCEKQVLVGSTQLASNTKTRFMIEMHSSQDRPQKQTTEEVLEWCAHNGYAAWYLKEAQRIMTADPVAHRGRYHLLLQPEAWSYPEWLRGIAQGASVDTVQVSSGM